MFSRFVHLILGLSISYPYLIKFHDFVDNSQEVMKKGSNEGFNSGPTGHDFMDNSNALGTNEPALGASFFS
jgi:hypothetical protein